MFFMLHVTMENLENFQNIYNIHVYYELFPILNTYMYMYSISKIHKIRPLEKFPNNIQYALDASV